MSRRSPCLRIVLCLALAAAAGCTPQQPFYFGDDGDLSHYKGIATDLEVPDVDQRPLDEVCGASAPLSLANPDAQEIWELSLEDAIRYTLENSKVMHYLGGTVDTVGVQTGSIAERAPNGMVTTVYDPALAESNPRFGTEAALSAFDAQFSTSVFWEKADKPLNRVASDIFPNVDRHDLGTFQSQLSKTNATGGTTAIGYNVYYDFDQASPVGPPFGRLWKTDWNVDVTAEFRQPLFQGYGVQFNRIAGPGAIPGYNNGVILARIQTDLALADFEDGVRGMLFDTEKAYWRLYFHYRQLDAAKVGRDAALQTWRRIYNLQQKGARGGEAAQEAQAREQYWLFVGAMETARSDVYTAESQLRYMMGLAVADGRQIRPSDEPTSARVSFDWREVMCEALVRNVDIRRQKWQVKQKELELISAKNYLLPRLDAVGQYRWRGLGNDYWLANQTANTFDSAMGNLVNGDFQDWQFGLEFSLPIGFRKQMAGVRYAQLDLAKQRSVLRELELETSHDLAAAMRELDKFVSLTRTRYEQYIAAKHEVAAVQAAYETGTITLNVLLESQRRAAEAEVEYYRSLSKANENIAYVHYIKGSLLEYNGVWLAEGPWVGKAYFDAHRRAQARDAGLYMDYGFTQPKVISQGPYRQQQNCLAMPTEQLNVAPLEQIEPQQILEPTPEELPTPSPTDSSRSSLGQPAASGPTLSEAAPSDGTVLRMLGEKTGRVVAASGSRSSDVRPAGYNAPASSTGKTTRPAPLPETTAGQWKSANPWRSDAQTRKTSWHESDSHPTSAQGAGAASGWKRM